MKNITFNDVICFLTTEELTRSQHNDVVALLKVQNKHRNKAVLRQVYPGDRVQFFADKLGRTVTAKVTKLGTKCIYCTNVLNGERWRVAAALCTKVSQ